jgi:hypothetical protein
MSRHGNYQDSVTVLLSRESDENAATQDDEDEQDELSLRVEGSDHIISAVEKASTVK